MNLAMIHGNKLNREKQKLELRNYNNNLNDIIFITYFYYLKTNIISTHK